jgi:hypothetical protein
LSTHGSQIELKKRAKIGEVNRAKNANSKALMFKDSRNCWDVT